MKPLYCWLNGHDYVFGYGRRLCQDEVLSVTVCVYCGARSIISAPEVEASLTAVHRG